MQEMYFRMDSFMNMRCLQKCLDLCQTNTQDKQIIAEKCFNYYCSTKVYKTGKFYISN